MNILKFNHLKKDNFNILTQHPLWMQWKKWKINNSSVWGS